MSRPASAYRCGAGALPAKSWNLCFWRDEDRVTHGFHAERNLRMRKQFHTTQETGNRPLSWPAAPFATTFGSQHFFVAYLDDVLESGICMYAVRSNVRGCSPISNSGVYCGSEDRAAPVFRCASSTLSICFCLVFFVWCLVFLFFFVCWWFSPDAFVCCCFGFFLVECFLFPDFCVLVFFVCFVFVWCFLFADGFRLVFFLPTVFFCLVFSLSYLLFVSFFCFALFFFLSGVFSLMFFVQCFWSAGDFVCWCFSFLGFMGSQSHPEASPLRRASTTEPSLTQHDNSSAHKTEACTNLSPKIRLPTPKRKKCDFEALWWAKW